MRLSRAAASAVLGFFALFATSNANNSHHQGVDYEAVKSDIWAALTDSKEFWPADFGNYGPFLIRLAWHCAGSYRTSDGRGGCDGGRIRYLPERGWPDNVNLDKALDVLEPLKIRHPSISWGDLIILAGTTAIEHMGGPVLGYCGGRTDDANGDASLQLGPTALQVDIANCTLNGNCSFPLGPTTIGLIYVNPEGHLADGDPVGITPDIRSSFGRMGMNDRETVALIGGGHSFGKAHGACPTGAGPSPIEDPANPWPGTCGNGTSKGKGRNTFSSGFEGPWTTAPTNWTNQYFSNLLDFNWTIITGPGAHKQWTPNAISGKKSPPSGIMMLTSDIGLISEDKYKALVQEYATNISSLSTEFAHAWYKLTSRDIGPAWRCKGPWVAPPQPFQLPLPDAPAQSADLWSLADKVKNVLSASTKGPSDTTADGQPYVGALLINVAKQCASSYRDTDHSGGCNGASFLLAPQNDYPLNKGTGDVVSSVLKPIADATPGASIADLIVLSGTVALAQASGRYDFYDHLRGGRVDLKTAWNLEEVSRLAPRTYIANPIVAVRDDWVVRGLTVPQGVALAGLPRSTFQQKNLGYSGSFGDPSKVDNTLFKLLVTESWVPTNKTGPAGPEYVAVDKPDVFVLQSDLVLHWDGEAKAVVQEFAADNDAFLDALVDAWSTIMNADLPPK
ncbi:putative catalase-peroxidase [Gonapodya prolifera JEL478]|uniref:Peroxidase n=1 Tax=Gonapodya prolifera (strain JEL478) TaxID=1344416 RepID=A0A139AXP1_GONPJ|nr:putative catalase-peroxidase [Gonapodya prolifera JEL478]|eukprot:KXS21477.1 putative catalase-peroxidase [Gonapodya prolifera JEL478]